MRKSGGVLMGVAAAMLATVLLSLAPTAHAQRGGTISCESQDRQFKRCPVPWRDAQIVRQDSKRDCVRGQNWGMDRQGIWVNGGCRAQFAEANSRGRGNDRHRGQPQAQRGGWQPGPNWNRQIQLECHSNSQRYQMCQVDVGPRGSVRLVKQQSRNSCQQGKSWGWNRAGVWVSNGCRATFAVDRRG